MVELSEENHEGTKAQRIHKARMMQSKHQALTEKEECFGRVIVDCAYQIHRKLGPGLLESVYETCFCYELSRRSDIFTIQDEITDRVAATLADNFGVLVCSMVASLEDKPDEQLSASERAFCSFE